MIEAIFFDAFGTLCEIRDKRNAYKPILKAWPNGVADAYQTLMTRDISPAALAREAGCTQEAIQRVQDDVQAETASIRLFPEVLGVLQTLRERGLKWAVVSNLATPYAAPLLKLFPFAPDGCAWSFSVGHRKPQAEIYLYACKVLGVQPASVLMVGDSLENDYTMPKQLGMTARYLKRDGKDKDMADCLASLDEVRG